MQSLERLILVEEQIKKRYLYLVQKEISGTLTEGNLSLIKQDILLITKEEASLLRSPEVSYQEMQQIIASKLTGYPSFLTLGVDSEAHLIRLYHMLESIQGDEGIEYADALKYDIHKIIMKFLENILANPYYASIREKLILFKYDLIFDDYNLEADYLLDNDMSYIKLNNQDYRIDLPSHKYIDQVILIYESKEFMQILRNYSALEEYEYADVIMVIIHILARLALCSENELAFVMSDFRMLLENEEMDHHIQNTIQEMLVIFRQIESNFHFSR